jgi:hypothetical protein
MHSILFSVSIQHYQRAQYIAYGGCRGNHIFDFIPLCSVAGDGRITGQESLVATDTLSYKAKIIDYGMAVGSLRIDPCRKLAYSFT